MRENTSLNNRRTLLKRFSTGNELPLVKQVAKKEKKIRLRKIGKIETMQRHRNVPHA